MHPPVGDPSVLELSLPASAQPHPPVSSASEHQNREESASGELPPVLADQPLHSCIHTSNTPFANHNNDTHVHFTETAASGGHPLHTVAVSDQMKLAQPEAAQPVHPAVKVALVRRFRLSSFLWGQVFDSPQYSATISLPDPDARASAKRDLIENFFTIPMEVEKLMFLGYFICLDALLYIFTMLPARLLLMLNSRSKRLSASQKVDWMKGLLFVIGCVLLENIDGSRVYHSMRGQSLIQLHLIYQMLEIGNSLLGALGHDILDSLFHGSSDSPTRSIRRRLNRVTHFGLALVYVFTHSLLLFYQVIALNIAFNSKSTTLFSLMLGNQFYEIKGFVFKKYDREFLFQLSCSDIVERFHISIFLLIISLRNFVEFTGANSAFVIHIFTHSIPSFFKSIVSTTISITETVLQHLNTQNSFMQGVFSLSTTVLSLPWISSLTIDPTTMQLLQTILLPAISILATELLVDWIKHAFMTRFNSLQPRVVYKKYRMTLLRDLSAKGASGAVARRVGFLALPMACLVVRIGLEAGRMVCVHDGDEGGLCDLLPWNMDWDVPRVLSDTVNGAIECIADGIEAPACLRGVWLHFGRDAQVAAGWLFARFAVVGGWLGIVLIIYVFLLALKVTIGYNLMRFAKSRMTRSIGTPVAATPSTPTGSSLSGRKMSGPLLIDAGFVIYPPKPKEVNGKEKVAGTSTKRSFPAIPTASAPNVDILLIEKDEKLDSVDRYLMLKRIV
ncbi:eukaryotic membrane protein family-domain-containing protein [Chytriomyces sp. MP71]|nr:eukaryotic membrane protein family-domain-containing protein [Chytriomyces sp. MP71]